MFEDIKFCQGHGHFLPSILPTCAVQLRYNSHNLENWSY